jgi:hypothetical protein
MAMASLAEIYLSHGIQPGALRCVDEQGKLHAVLPR